MMKSHTLSLTLLATCLALAATSVGCTAETAQQGETVSSRARLPHSQAPVPRRLATACSVALAVSTEPFSRWSSLVPRAARAIRRIFMCRFKVKARCTTLLSISMGSRPP
jgi:hypothetical protein